jgi:hypothetical protein
VAVPSDLGRTPALCWIAYSALLFPFAVSRAPGWLPDASIYLLMAEALSPWGGPASAAARHALAQSAFPPLFPLLVGLVGGGGDAAIARAVSAACLCAALPVLLAWLRARGMGGAPALLATAAFALSPLTLLQAQEGLSEPLYLLLGLLALLAAERALPERAASGRLRLAAALAAGLALATRSAGVAWLAALAAWWIARRVPLRRLPALLAAALGPMALWWLAKRWLGLTGSYGGALESRLAHYADERGAALARAIPEQLGALFGAWHSVFALHPGAWTRSAAIAIGALALLGLARGLARMQLAALYAALYPALIALWPFPAHAGRFLWPLVPLLLAFAAESASALSRRAAGAVAVLALALLLALPSLGVIASRFRAALRFDATAFTHTPRWYLADWRGARDDARMREGFAQAMRAVADHVPADACVYAVSPEELMAWSRRVALLPPPRSVGDLEFEAATRECDWFFLAPLVVFPYDTPYYPRERLGDDFELIALPGSEPPFALARRRERPAQPRAS